MSLAFLISRPASRRSVSTLSHNLRTLYSVRASHIVKMCFRFRHRRARGTSGKREAGRRAKKCKDSPENGCFARRLFHLRPLALTSIDRGCMMQTISGVRSSRSHPDLNVRRSGNARIEPLEGLARSSHRLFSPSATPPRCHARSFANDGWLATIGRAPWAKPTANRRPGVPTRTQGPQQPTHRRQEGTSGGRS